MIDILIKATILLALVAVAAHLVRHRSAALRHQMWAFAITGLILMPLLTKVVPFQLRVLPPAPSAVVRLEAERPAQGSVLLPPTSESPHGSTDAEAAGPAGPASGRMNLPSIPFAIWIAGALLLLGRFVAGLVTVHRIAGRARAMPEDVRRSIAVRSTAINDIRSTVGLRLSDEVAMPFAHGIVRPTIVLPAESAEWADDRREAVLLHELAHISRGDLAVNMLSQVVRALYWFHPLAWLAAHRLRVEGERACDDAVLRAGARPSDYADHLLSIVRSVGSTVPEVALAMARRSDFEGRLLAILEPGVPRGRLTRWSALGLAAVFLAAVLPLAAMAPGGRQVVTPSVAVREDAGGAVNQAQDPLPAPSAAIAALSGMLDDANGTVRLAAVSSLGQLQDPAAITALSRALKEDTDARVREAAAWALGEIDDTRAVPALVEALKTERVAKVREKIVLALGEIDDASAGPAIAAVLKDGTAEVRRAAVRALGELEDPSAAPALGALARDSDLEVRRNVAEALGQLENPVAVDPLQTLARDADSEVRAAAIESLGRFHDQPIMGTLLNALKDSDAEVRSAAAEAIGQVENVKAAPRGLIDALADPDRDVRRNAAESLANIGDEAAVPALKRLVSDSDTDTRRTAVEALREIGGAEAMQAFMTLLKDPDPEIRKLAAEALGKRR